jgi:hypothetical protein
MVLKPTELKQKAEEIYNEGISQLEKELEQDMDKVIIRYMDDIIDVMENGPEFCFSYPLNKFYSSRVSDYFGNIRRQAITATSSQLDVILQRTIEKYKQAGWGISLYKKENSLGLSVRKLNTQGGI